MSSFDAGLRSDECGECEPATVEAEEFPVDPLCEEAPNGFNGLRIDCFVCAFDWSRKSSTTIELVKCVRSMSTRGYLLR